MNLSDIVTSLELSKKLLALGVKQCSIFHWVEIEKDNEIYQTIWVARELNNTIACAFTASELLDLMPKYIEIVRGCRFDEVIPTYLIKHHGETIVDDHDTNLADSCAKMLIHLIENKLIEV